ncbi:hypothetical protein [Sporichthya sp.]|uniref:hypothetical protein n=1 Tax=Sporichthya sp. TaxID=65475 RepID=UPI001804BFC0|nr:hypothetical protein [Sporichthya sp.]MBA3744027.1 hypothetical protein [Sporichthya sp.]
MKTSSSRRGKVALALVPVLAAAGITLLTAGAANAATGLAFTPATGATNVEAITFTIPAACPAGSTDFFIEIVGGGFPSGSFAIGQSALSPGQTSFPTSNWNAIAGNNGAALPLSGTATMDFKCNDGATVFQNYTGSVTFTPTAGSNSSYALVAAATPTPTPVPPTPTPVPTPVPTPTPTPTPTPVPAPGSANTGVTVTVPDQGQTGGAFTISTPVGATIDMGTPTTGTSGGINFLNYTTLLSQFPVVSVNDSRPGLLAWSVVGQLSNFNPGLVFGRYMGWTPAVTSPAGSSMGAVAGSNVPSGYPGTTSGLKSGRLMASAPDGHGGDAGTTATLGAVLNLHVPTSVPADTYTAVLTVTALS